MKKLLLIIVLATTFYSCDVKQSEEYKKLVSENITLMKTIDSLNNTPDRIYYRGINHFNAKKLDSAIVEFDKIKSLYKGSIFFDKAKVKINQAKKLISQKEKEKELKLKLKFKALKEQKKFRIKGLTVSTFGHNFTSEFDFDRYDDRYKYRQAKRGFKYLSFDARISSEENTPLLPAFFVYVLENGVLKRITNFRGMEIEFYEWEDYGTYLGNDADFSNDFERTKMIRFDIGGELKISDYKGKEVYLVATKLGQMFRDYNEFSNPPISYKKRSTYEAPEKLLTPDDFENEFILIKKLKP